MSRSIGKSCREKSHILCSVAFPPENGVIYEIMCKNWYSQTGHRWSGMGSSKSSFGMKSCSCISTAFLTGIISCSTDSKCLNGNAHVPRSHVRWYAVWMFCLLYCEIFIHPLWRWTVLGSISLTLSWMSLDIVIVHKNTSLCSRSKSFNGYACCFL